MAHLDDSDPFLQGLPCAVSNTNRTTAATNATSVFGYGDDAFLSRKGKMKVLTHNPFSSMGSNSGKEEPTNNNSSNSDCNNNNNNNIRDNNSGFGTGGGVGGGFWTNSATATTPAVALREQTAFSEEQRSSLLTPHCSLMSGVERTGTHTVVTPSWNGLPGKDVGYRRQEQQVDSRHCQPHVQQQQEQQQNAGSFLATNTPQVLHGATSAMPATLTKTKHDPSSNAMSSTCLLSVPPRIPELSCTYSGTRDVDKTQGIAGSKKAYYFSLLKKDPPDFLKPSIGTPMRRTNSSGAVPSQSQYNTFVSNSCTGRSAQTTLCSRSASIGTNFDGQQQPNVQEVVSFSSTPRPNEGQDAVSLSYKESDFLERQGKNGDRPPTSFFSTGHAGLSTTFATSIQPGHGSGLKVASGSFSSVQSGSFGENTMKKNHDESFVAECQPLVKEGGGVFVRSCGATKKALIETEITDNTFAASLGSTTNTITNTIMEGAATMTHTLSKAKTAQLTKPPLGISFVSKNAGDVTESLLPLQEKRPPSSLHLFQKGGEVGMSNIMPAVTSCSAQLGLDTPRNGGMGLQRQQNRDCLAPSNTVTDSSPAPFPPSRQESQAPFVVDAASYTTDFGPHVESNEDKEDWRPEQPMGLSQKSLVPSSGCVVGGMTGSPSPTNIQPAMELHRDERIENTTTTTDFGRSEGSCFSPPPPLPTTEVQPQFLQEATKLGQLEVSSGVEGDVFLGTKTHLGGATMPNKRFAKIPSYALFTSTGHVVMVSNVSRSQNVFAVLKSQSLADILSANSEMAKLTEAAEKRIGMLRVLIMFYSFLTSLLEDKNVSFLGLQDIVRKMPGISPLLREVLVFLLREPLPDWRTEGHHTLIKILSTAANEVKIDHERHLSHYPLNKEPKVDGAAEGLRKIQQLLCAGEREAAVDTALEHHLYSHAIIISMVCPKKEQYLRVISAIVHQELDPFSPLAHAYCMFNEMSLTPFAPPQPQTGLPSSVDLKTGGESLLRSLWVQQAAILVSNFTRESADGLIELGDALLRERMVDEAHCCFLLAYLSPMGRLLPGRQLQQKQRHVMDLLCKRLGILGGHYNPQCSRTLFVSPKSTLLTEVLQIVRSRLESCSAATLGGSDKQTVQHGLPVCPERYRAAFRYMQVLWLREVGLTREALPMLSSVHSLVPPDSPDIPHFTLNRLIYLSDFTLSATFTEDRQTPTALSGQAPVMQVTKYQNVQPPSTQEILQTSAATSAVPPTTTPPPPPPPLLPSQSASSSSSLPAQPDHPPRKMMPNLSLKDPKSVAGLPPLQGPSMAVSQGLSATWSAEKTSPLLTLQTPLSTTLSAHQQLAVSAAQSSTAPTLSDVSEQADFSAASPRHLSKPTQGRVAGGQSAQPKSTNRSSSLEALTKFIFRRGRSREVKGDEAKAMIIDTAKPPKFDPATGRYLFEETEEEKKVTAMVKAGPPKPSFMTAKGVSPLPMPHKRAASGPLPRAQYVDMFNST